MIAVGVDTHKHWHVAVALDALGQVLGEIVIAATGAGYGELVAWLSGLEGEVVVGIEGAGVMALVCASICAAPAWSWSRWSGRAGAIDAPASRIRSTRFWRQSECWLAMASRRRARPAAVPR